MQDNNKNGLWATISGWALAIILTIIFVGYGATNYLSKTPLERRLHACNGIFQSTNTTSCQADKALYEMSGGHDNMYGID